MLSPEHTKDIIKKQDITKEELDSLKQALGANPGLAKDRDTNGLTLLHHAARNGHAEVVKLLLGNEADVDVRDTEERIPLHYAAISGSVEVVRALIARDARVDVRDTEERTPLHYAAISGSVEVVKALIEEGADVNALGKGNNTPLYLAAGNGHAEVVKLLLQNGADVSVANSYGETPLHAAALHGSVEVVNALIEKKADVKAKNIERRNPLHLAAISGSVEAVQALIRGGADVNKGDKDGKTPLHYAARSAARMAAKLSCSELMDRYNCCIGVIEALLKAKEIDVNAKDNDGNTPLHLVVQESFNSDGCKKIAKLLLDNGADVFAKNERGGTPLSCSPYSPRYCTRTLVIEYIAADPKTKINEEPSRCWSRFVGKLNQKKPEDLIEKDLGHWNECLEEIERLKKRKVYGDITFYDVLVGKHIKNNKEIVAILEMGSYEEEFPIYGGRIKSLLQERKEEANSLCEDVIVPGSLKSVVVTQPGCSQTIT